MGIHQTGIVVGCLRNMQRWNFASNMAEYRSHSGPTKHHYKDETYIEVSNRSSQFLATMPQLLAPCLNSWPPCSTPGESKRTQLEGE